jgi:hypothetical protein
MLFGLFFRDDAMAVVNTWCATCVGILAAQSRIGHRGWRH